jgi:hypothetical protein
MTDRNTILANLTCALMRYGEGEDMDRYAYGIEIRRDSAKQKQTVFFRMADKSSHRIHTMTEAISDTNLRLYDQNDLVHRIVIKISERWEYFKKMGIFPPKDSIFG